MERLIYSNSIPSKFHFNRPYLQRLPRFDSPRRLAPSSSSFPLLACAESHRVNPLATSLRDPYFVSKNPNDECPQNNLSSSVDSASGLEAKPRFMDLIAQNLSERKVIVDFFAVLLYLSLVYLNSVSRLALLSVKNENSLICTSVASFSSCYNY